MKERDDLAEALVAIEKKARLAVMKDQIGVDELADSSGLSGGRFVCYTFETCPGTVPEQLWLLIVWFLGWWKLQRFFKFSAVALSFRFNRLPATFEVCGQQANGATNIGNL